MVLRSIGVLSLAKIQGLIGVVVGLLAGAMMAVMSLLGAAARGGAGGVGPFELGFGVGALIAAPIFYGIFGFIGGALTALIYNVLASVVGGVQLDLVHEHEAER